MVGGNQEEEGQPTKQNDQISLDIQTSERGLLDGKKHEDVVRSVPKRTSYMKFGPSPSAKFRKLVEERDAISRSVPSTNQPSKAAFFKNIDWVSLREMCKGWIRNPMNLALLAWISCVAISGAILFFVMTGMLNAALPRKSQRESWFEVNNQILNALFTLMCLYQHPKRFYHLALLLRWRPGDIVRLRRIYCKNGTYKPDEWTHMMVVVLLLHLNCFAQYSLCGLNLGYSRRKRPAIGVAICISVAIGAPAFAAVYNILSPLGREYEEEEAVMTTCVRRKSLQKRYSFVAREDGGESRPEWIGGLFELHDDVSTAWLSLFCSCCVFGWNMERLGFGNMYVHVATFLLFCIAPFFIFNLAAINVEDERVREGMAIAGVALCVLGLLYGGFWRIQMRKKFGLPGRSFCCGNASVTDCFQWLCCCSCSLAQEVRTADFYDVVEDRLCPKEARGDGGDDGVVGVPMSPLGREGTSPITSPFRTEGSGSSPRGLDVLEESSMEGKDHAMDPPIVSVVQRD